MTIEFAVVAISICQVVQMAILTWAIMRIDILEKQVSELHKEKKERYEALLAARDDFLKFLKGDNNDLMA